MSWAPLPIHYSLIAKASRISGCKSGIRIISVSKHPTSVRRDSRAIINWAAK
jgi:hypothetical protein